MNTPTDFVPLGAAGPDPKIEARRLDMITEGVLKGGPSTGEDN